MRLLLACLLAVSPVLNAAAAGRQAAPRAAISSGVHAHIDAAVPGAVSALRDMPSLESSAVASALLDRLAKSNDPAAAALTNALGDARHDDALRSALSSEVQDQGDAIVVNRVMSVVRTAREEIQKDGAQLERLRKLKLKLAGSAAEAALSEFWGEGQRSGPGAVATEGALGTAAAKPQLAAAAPAAPKAASAVTSLAPEKISAMMTPAEAFIERATRGSGTFIRGMAISVIARRLTRRVQENADPQHPFTDIMSLSASEIERKDIVYVKRALQALLVHQSDVQRTLDPVIKSLDNLKAESKERAQAALPAHVERIWSVLTRFGVKQLTARPLTTAFRTFMDYERWEDMIRLYDESISEDFRQSTVIKQFLAVALGKVADKSFKAGDRAYGDSLLARAELVLASVPAHEVRGEDAGLLGKIWKLRYQDALNRSKSAQGAEKRRLEAEAESNLRKSIEVLRSGFLNGFEHYPGINLVLNLYALAALTKDVSHAAEAKKLARLVYASAEKAGGLRSNDFWALATLYQAAAIGGMAAEMREVIKRFGAIKAPQMQITSTLATVRDLRDQMAALSASAETVADLEYGIQALETGARVEAGPAEPLSEAALKAEAVFSTGYYLGELPSSHIGGNIEFGGQEHHRLLNRRDMAAARAILTRLRLSSADSTYDDFNAQVPNFLRGVFGIKALEPLHMAAHKIYDRRVRRLLNFIVGRGSDGLTSVHVDLWLRLGDCRPTAMNQQLLFDVWKTDQINRHLRAAYDAMQTGNEAAQRRAMDKVAELRDLYMLTMDARVMAQVKGERYKVEKDKDGVYELGDAPMNMEDHTLNLLMRVKTLPNGTRELTELRLVDSWYHDEFKFGGTTVVGGRSFAGVPIPLDRVTLEKDKDGVVSAGIFAGIVSARDAATGRVVQTPLKLEKLPYGGDQTKKSGGLSPNRGDYGQAMMRGLIVRGLALVRGVPDVSGFFNARLGRAIHGLFDRIGVWQEKQERQNGMLAWLLRSRTTAREAAVYSDANYYRGQGKEPVPFVTDEQLEQRVRQRVETEKAALNLAGLYALETGMAWLSYRDRVPMEEVLRRITADELPYSDMLVLARFSNLTWKAGQPFRGQGLERIESEVFKPTALLDDKSLQIAFGQIRGAAALLKQRLGDAKGRELVAALTKLLQSQAFAREMARHLDAEFFRARGEVPPAFLSEAEKRDTILKTFETQKTAANLPGFYAAETALAVFAESRGMLPLDLLDRIASGNLEPVEKELLKRLSNAAWKAGQPFGIDPADFARGGVADPANDHARITRPVMAAFDALSKEDQEKDWHQIAASARLLRERMARFPLTEMAVSFDRGAVTIDGKAYGAGGLSAMISERVADFAEKKLDAVSAERVKEALADPRRMKELESRIFRLARRRGSSKIAFQAVIQDDKLVLRLADEDGLVGRPAPSLAALDRLLSAKGAVNPRAERFVLEAPLAPAY